jgi:pyruvate/2-oxoglutarate dehydrogenase complex dihydrolipoamide acyltransferase (E2) component
MAVDVKIPTDLWEEDTEAAITSWLVSDGATVSEGQLIAEIMVEKVQYEIKSPASGTIKIGLPVEAVAAKGSAIASVS